jgi:hypothetical protein
VTGPGARNPAPPRAAGGGLRRLLRPVCLLALAAAAPHTIPLPPIPPATPPSDTAAPVPDVDLHAPIAVATEETRLRLRLFRMQRYDASRGFLPGSRYESSEDRKPIQTPGFIVSVPLH